jgi:ABC-type sugar transport system ATPase subunit
MIGDLVASAVRPQGPTADELAPLVRVTGVAKAFGPTQALRDASFDVRAGEVHALVGENGSGKSTLVKILSGVHIPDAGSFEFAGLTMSAPPSPRAAADIGIVTVFQEVLVAPSRSVLDNVWLGVDGLLRARLSQREKRARADQAFEELLGRTLGLETPVERLSLSDRQACGIARALLRKPRILILDEATSALDVSARDRLFQIVDRLVQDGVGVVFITHRMDELDVIGDRTTVMRSGKTVATLQRGGWTASQLIRLMTGSDRFTAGARKDANPRATPQNGLLLSAKGLKIRPDRLSMDIEIHAGELVGVAGLEGHGQDAFLDALRGADRSGGDVVRHYHDRTVAIRSPDHAAEHHIVYVPRERVLDSLFGWMSIRENFALPTLARDSHGGLLLRSATRRRFADYASRLSIVFGNQDDQITTLSGGNQQKVVIARWLAAGPRVLLLNDPTRGIDIGAKRDLYVLLTDLVHEGLAVVMLSTEVDEHIELMDRVLVFREHQLFAEIQRSALSRGALVSAYFGEDAR